MTYLLPKGAPLVKGYSIGPSKRSNIWVNLEDAQLASTDVSAVVRVTNDVPIIVERAMYRTGGGRMWTAGHESAGVTAPALSWFLAEGNTGPFFDLFVLIANPNAQDAAITARFLLADGTVIAKDHVVSGNSRFNIWVDYEDAALADAAVSTTIQVTNGVPVIVERAMWWPGPFATWHEAHNSPGSTETGTLWGVAEGEVGGADAVETYLLIANTSAFDGQARVTLLFEDGTTAETLVLLKANSRTNVQALAAFGADRERQAVRRDGREPGGRRGHRADRRGARDVLERRRRAVVGWHECPRHEAAMNRPTWRLAFEDWVQSAREPQTSSTRPSLNVLSDLTR